MAEGADGEEEIQFLRTVSDAVTLSQPLLNLHSHDEWSVGYCVLMMDDKAVWSLLLMFNFYVL